MPDLDRCPTCKSREKHVAATNCFNAWHLNATATPETEVLPLRVRLHITSPWSDGFRLTPAATPIDTVPEGDEYVVECVAQRRIQLQYVVVQSFALVDISIGGRNAFRKPNLVSTKPADCVYRIDPPLVVEAGEYVRARLCNDTPIPLAPLSALFDHEDMDRAEDAVACPACDHGPGISCDGPVSHPVRVTAYNIKRARAIDYVAPEGREPFRAVNFLVQSDAAQRILQHEVEQRAQDAGPQRDWVINDVQVDNRCGFCGKSFNFETGHVCAEAAISPGGKTFLTTVRAPAPKPDPDRHAPRIARTLAEGPGNATLIRGCACGAEVMSAEAYATHVGWPVDAVRALLGIYGIADDLVVRQNHARLNRGDLAQQLSRCLEIRQPPPADYATSGPYEIKHGEIVGPNLRVIFEHVIELLHMRHENDPKSLPTTSVMMAFAELIALLNGAYDQGRRGVTRKDQL